MGETGGAAEWREDAVRRGKCVGGGGKKGFGPAGQYGVVTRGRRGERESTEDWREGRLTLRWRTNSMADVSPDQPGTTGDQLLDELDNALDCSKL